MPDLSSFRRIPWEDHVPFFLVSFFEPDTGDPLSACSRGLLKSAADKWEKHELKAMAGVSIFHCLLDLWLTTIGLIAEYEFHQYKVPVVQNASTTEPNSTSIAKFLAENAVNALTPITEGMFGYSLTRPIHNQDYYYGIFETCKEFDCGIESWHTESGPGVFEAVRLNIH